MALQFQAPEGLINEYFNRKQPAEVANEGIQQALQTYVQQKALQQTQQLAQQQKDIEMAKGMATNGQDFMDALKKIQEARNPTSKPVTSTPSQYPLTQSNIPPAESSSLQPETNYQPASGDPALAVTPDGNHIINHWNATMGAAPGGPTPPGGKPQDAGSLTNSPLTDPLVQEYQKDPIAFKKQHGEAGIAKLKTQAETDKLLTEKGNTPWYDAKGNKQFETPANGKIIPGSVTANGKTFVGNDADGNPIVMDKGGNFSKGNVPTGGPILPKSSTMPTSSTRASAEFANTIIPHIQDMRDLVKQADKKGFIGPMAGRVYGDFMAGKVGSTGNPEADQLLGRLRATDSLLKTGAMRVHFGARGGGQMYDHFSDLLNSGKQSAAMLNGSLDTLESFMQGYSNAGKVGNKGNAPTTKTGDPLGIR